MISARVVKGTHFSAPHHLRFRVRENLNMNKSLIFASTSEFKKTFRLKDGLSIRHLHREVNKAFTLFFENGHFSIFGVILTQSE